MTICRGDDPTTYTKVSNAVAQDHSISLEAKGVWLYLITKPLDWKILPAHLAKECGVGKDKMYRILKELIDHKLCVRIQGREKHSSGRYVVGEIEYFIYSEPVQESFVLPENQKPENVDPQIDDGKQIIDITKKRNNKRVAENRGTYQVESKKVVVFPFLLTVFGLSDASSRKLMSEYSEEQLERAVNMLRECKKAPDNPYGWLVACIEEEWKPKPSAEKVVAENRKWAHDVLDGRTIGPTRLEALNGHLEFVHGGMRPPDCFDYSQNDFQDVVKKHYKMLMERFRGG